MEMVKLTRKLRQAALVALPLSLLACNADSIAGPEPADAILARGGGAGAGGNAHWVVGTGYDFESQTFSFRAAGLGKNQSFTVGVSAHLTVSYDCENSLSGEYTPNAFEGVQESITGSQVFTSGKNGSAQGSVGLDLDSQGTLSCVAGWEATNLRIQSAGMVVVNVQPAYLPGLTYYY